MDGGGGGLLRVCASLDMHLPVPSPPPFPVPFSLSVNVPTGSTRAAWEGSWGPLVHVHDLWEQLWSQWQLLGDSVSVQWVPSHVLFGGRLTCPQECH